MRIILITILSFLFLATFAQKVKIKPKIQPVEDSAFILQLPTTNYKNIVVKKDIVYIRNDSAPFTGIVCKYQGKTMIKEKMIYKNGLLNGTYTIYFSNGNKSKMATFENGKLNGLSTWYHLKGNVNMQGYYRKDKMEGTWYWWYDTGNLKQKGNFKNGKMQGIWYTYYKNTMTEYKKKYKDGKMNGKWLWLYPDGENYIKGKCKNDLRNGKWTWWYPNGNKKMQGKFINGNMEEHWKEWNSYGIFEREAIYQDNNEVQVIHELKGAKKTKDKISLETEQNLPINCFIMNVTKNRSKF